MEPFFGASSRAHFLLPVFIMYGNITATSSRFYFDFERRLTLISLFSLTLSDQGDCITG
jgi:hypothetical protein